jgi:micrococcal nuclease
MMKAFFVLLVLIITPFYSALSAQSDFSAVVTKIIDGDSIVVKTGKRFIEVRLYGIDCPEWNQRFSAEARKYTTVLLHRKRITVTPLYYDSYGRLVALLSQNGQDINGALVKSGSAWVYPRYCRKSVCDGWLADQQIAKENGKGLWADESPVSPWRWKTMHR